MIRGQTERKTVTVVAKGRSRKVQLPLKWSDSARADYQDFSLLSVAERTHVVRAITEFSYFLHHVFLPDFCRGENEAWPEVLWPHAQEIADDYQRAVPPTLLPFEVFADERNLCGRICRVAPNRTLKSTITSGAFPLWMIGGNPEFVRIMLTTNKLSLGIRHLSLHKEHILANTRFSDVFGVLRAQKSPQQWTADRFFVDPAIRKSDPTVSVFGVGGAIEGQGMDIGIVDDCQVFHNAATVDARDNQWMWLAQAFEKRLDPHARLILLIQTRHADDDFAGRAKLEAANFGSWDYKEYPAIYGYWPPQADDFKRLDLPANELWRVENMKDPEDWKSRLLCPEVLPLQTLMTEWAMEGGRDAFFKTRLNKVRDPNTKWLNRDDLKNWARADGGARLDHMLRPKLTAWSAEAGRPQKGSALYEELMAADVEILRLVVSIDTAATVQKPGRNPDYTVIQLWALDGKHRRRIMFDMVRFRTSDPAYFRLQLGKFVDAYHPEFVIMETNAMARWIGVETQNALGVPIRSHQRGAKDVQEIEVFKDLAQSGLLLYAWGDWKSAEKMKPFEDELDAYPDGSHDDTLITAVQAQELLRPANYEMRAYRPQREVAKPEIMHEGLTRQLRVRLDRLSERLADYAGRTES